MRFLPHTMEQIQQMLAVVGADSLESLFSGIPEECRRLQEMNLPEALSEWALNRYMDNLSDTMAVSPAYRVFIGAGRYDHHIPATVSALKSRSEFLTAYTPYQPEISQGTLQAIYEYQTLAARLMGVDVVTASHYDGATALSEALLMAIRKTRRKRVALSSLIHPFYRRVARTYLEPAGFEIIELPFLESGLTDLSSLEGTSGFAAVALQSPNFFGCIEDLKTAGQKAHGIGALFIAGFTEALAFGLLKSPGSHGADIVFGEGQSLGIPIAFGGPGLGMLGCSAEHTRNLPGRLVGKAKDMDGKNGFVLTLATREQHIRREKATSNICSNNSHCALTAAMYMASLGKSGFCDLAKLNHDKAAYLCRQFTNAGFRVPFSSPFFNEFVVEFPEELETLYQRLLEKNFVAGLPLSAFYPELSHHYLLCVTETASREDMDALIREVTPCMNL
ncbi:MAG: aminomethyl-transferring glycine dehydrogenase subunit GcvPA [Deltaproteobacteria bacterium]|nr:aminomethyl-transferring glycine dehydrogenase subunit GcvPA [Deltaproteobacteria bacterium]